VPSYKKHVLFTIIFTLPFFLNIFYLSLAIIGSSIIDLDHHIKKKNLIIITVFGLILSISLYLANLPFLIGICLVLIAFVFYISKHRGFLHSLAGILFISIIISLFVFSFYNLLENFNFGFKLPLLLISILLGLIILNKKFIPVFCILVPIGILLTPFSKLTFDYVFFAIFLGSFSHLVLDLFTPHGLELLKPLSSVKCRRTCGIIFLVSWGFFSIISLISRKIIL
jgi:inner membrane protein